MRTATTIRTTITALLLAAAERVEQPDEHASGQGRDGVPHLRRETSLLPGDPGQLGRRLAAALNRALGLRLPQPHPSSKVRSCH